MRTLISLTVLIAGITFPAAAQGEEPGKLIAPLIDDDTVVVVHVNLAKVDFDDLFKHVESFGLIHKDDRADLHKKWLQIYERFTKAGGRELFLLAGLTELAIPGQALPIFAFPLEEGVDRAKLAALLKDLGVPAQVEKVGRFAVVGSKSQLERLKKIQPRPRPEVSQAFAATGTGFVQLAFFPTPDLRRAVNEFVPTLPPELGSGPSKNLTKGMRWLAAGFSIAPPGEYRLILQGADADAAQALQRMARAAIDVGLRGLIKHLAQEKEGPPPLDAKLLDKALASFQISVADNQLVVTVPVNKLAPLTVVIHASIQAKSARVQVTNNLKQIGLSFHNFQDINNRLPGNIVDKNGKPLLSWRVAILPLIEQTQLYNQFHFDEPWDSEHNKKLISQMPAVYRRSTFRADAGKTTYLMPAGKDTVLCPNEFGLLFAKDKFMSRDAKNPGVRLQDIPDGTSNTIMIVDVKDERAVAWTKPDDWVPDVADPRKGVAGSSPGGFVAGFADGSVRFIPANVRIATLRAYLTRSGGEVIED